MTAQAAARPPARRRACPATRYFVMVEGHALAFHESERAHYEALYGASIVGECATLARNSGPVIECSAFPRRKKSPAHRIVHAKIITERVHNGSN